jgi:hypothetical protein
MSRRPRDHGLVVGWLARALELAEAGGAAHARALVTKSLLEDDAESAKQAVALAEKLGDPVLLSYAYWARSGLAFVGFDFHEADRWAQRRFELLDHVTDPDKVAHVLYYAAPAALAAGRPGEADTLVRRHDSVASRLSTHHEVHALAVLLFIEEALGRWEEIRKLQPRVERAVAANTATPCMLNPRALFSCAVACAEIGLVADAERLEAAGIEQGFEGGDVGIWLDPPLAHLALLRGDLERVDALLASSGALWQWTTDCSLYSLATKLDALIAVGRASEAETLATTLLEPATYLEPFALRALGRIRADSALTERAVERFGALGLGRHADRTRALAGAGAGRRSQPTS